MWSWPAALGGLTLIGLVAALVGDGWWDWLSVLALSTPLVAAAWFGRRRP